MSIKSPGNHAKRHDLAKQISIYCHEPGKVDEFDFSVSTFIAQLNRLHPKKVGKTKVEYVRQTPTPSGLTSLVLQHLGIDASAVAISSFVDEEEIAFSDATKGLSYAELEELLGANAAPDSALMQGFRALDRPLSEFYGNLYNPELDRARLLGLFIVERADKIRASDIDLGEAI